MASRTAVSPGKSRVYSSRRVYAQLMPKKADSLSRLSAFVAGTLGSSALLTPWWVFVKRLGSTSIEESESVVDSRALRAPACGGLVDLHGLRPARWTSCTPVVESLDAGVGLSARPEVEDGDAPSFQGPPRQFASRLRDGLHAVKATEPFLGPIHGLQCGRQEKRRLCNQKPRRRASDGLILDGHPAPVSAKLSLGISGPFDLASTPKF